MKSIVQQVIDESEFQQTLREDIANKIILLPGKALDRNEGPVDATVSIVDVGSTFRFDDIDGDGLVWSADFSASCDLTLQYLTSDGETRSCENSGECKGRLEITFPNRTLSYDDIDDILSGLDVNISVSEAPTSTKGGTANDATT